MSISQFWTESKTIQSSNTPSLEEDSILLELYHWLKSDNRRTRKLIQEYYLKTNFDYVKWNILYANRYAKGSYFNFLNETLKHNWALEFREKHEKWIEQKKEPFKLDLQAEIVRNIALKADYIIMERGKRYKIKQVFDNGEIEVTQEDLQKTLIISPERAFNCQFESVTK